MFARPATARRIAAAAVIALSTGAAGAQDLRSTGYAPAYGNSVGYGFADEAVRGAYIGAPLTRFPSPNRLVPAAWSYGTYGVPTISGLREVPLAIPSITVINEEGGTTRQSPGPRILSRNGGRNWSSAAMVARTQSGARVVEVSVPRR